MDNHSSQKSKICPRLLLFVIMTSIIIINTSSGFCSKRVTTQLDNNTYDEDSPQISASNVVWRGFDGNDYEIILKGVPHASNFFGLKYALTYNTYDDRDPQISENNVVWRGAPNGEDYEIFYFNGSEITQLTNNPYDDASPQISESNIVWKSFDGEDYEIFYFDGIDTVQLTNNSFDDDDPQVSGSNVVWSGYDGADYEIFYYDGAVITQVTDNSTQEFYPQISGKNIVWQGNQKIFFYDGSAITQISGPDSPTSPRNPQISGNNVVWTEEIGYDKDIFYFNGSETIQLTNNTINDAAPQISGDKIVWLSGSATYDVFLYENEKTHMITNSSTASTAHISGNNIVWTDYDGNDKDIYFDTIYYTQDDIDQWDVDHNNKVSLADAINALKTVAGQ